MCHYSNSVPLKSQRDILGKWLQGPSNVLKIRLHTQHMEFYVWRN